MKIERSACEISWSDGKSSKTGSFTISTFGLSSFFLGEGSLSTLSGDSKVLIWLIVFPNSIELATDSDRRFFPASISS